MDTREKLLLVATRRFADDGFERTRLIDIAGELCVTKQALLHHFGTKEKLYSEVLRRISEAHIRQTRSLMAANLDPQDTLRMIFLKAFSNAMSNSSETRLLVRELLDNHERAASARVWFLKPQLELLTDLILQLPNWRGASLDVALVKVFQLLGAINYFAISQPTLEQMYGSQVLDQSIETFPEELKQLVENLISAGPSLLV